MFFLQDKDISSTYATKIYKTDGKRSIEKCKKIHIILLIKSGELGLKLQILLLKRWEHL